MTDLTSAPAEAPDTSSLDDLLLDSMTQQAEFSLDGLLAESLQEKRDREAVTASRKILAKGGLDVSTKQHIEASIRAWEAKREWDAQANVSLFHRQFCECCDRCTVQFAGFYQRQSHRHSKISRWVQSNLTQMKLLPKEVKYEEEVVAHCEDCAGAAGYPIDEYEITAFEEAVEEEKAA